MTGLSIMGLLPPGGSIVDGSIMFGDTDLTTLSQDELRKIRGNDIAMVFQDSLTALNPTKSIGYQVAEPAWLHRGMNQEGGSGPSRRGARPGRHPASRASGSRTSRISSPAACGSGC